MRQRPALPARGRDATDALYSGDREHRIRQELLLGVGGVRALEALGVDANVFHMNEGHSAFLAIERIRSLVQNGMSTDDAIAHVKASTVFTTHTPVPAGNEIFGTALIRRYVAPLANEAGIPEEYLLSLGEFGEAEAFGLTPMSLRLSAYANGVSALHGEVAREMWSSLENVDTEIGHVTNGVHLGTWLDPALSTLLRWTGVDRDRRARRRRLGERAPTSTRRSSGTSTTPPSASWPS